MSEQTERGHGREWPAAEPGEKTSEGDRLGAGAPDRTLFGYLGLGVATDTVMDQLRGPVDQL